MDLLALESEHEAKYFHKASEKYAQYFDGETYIGGVNDEIWYWIATNKPINYQLNITSAKKSSQECLSIVKGSNRFSYKSVACSTDEAQKFICHKMIIKPENWMGSLFR